MKNESRIESDDIKKMISSYLSSMIGKEVKNMFHNVGRRFIWFLIGSTFFATFIGYALFKAGLIALPGIHKSPGALNIKDRNRNRRVGRIRVT